MAPVLHAWPFRPCCPDFIHADHNLTILDPKDDFVTPAAAHLPKLSAAIRKPGHIAVGNTAENRS